jgi:cytochrome c oxidase assembly protein COX15 homolog
MVQSGLKEETAKKYVDPRVSHYRLAAHLGTAFVFYSSLFYTGLSFLLPPHSVKMKLS